MEDIKNEIEKLKSILIEHNRRYYVEDALKQNLCRATDWLTARANAEGLQKCIVG